MGEKELGNPSGVNVFCVGAVNYPLHKAMVYHDHYCIETMRIGQSHDEIRQYGGERERAFYCQGRESRHHGVSIHLGCLTIGTLLLHTLRPLWYSFGTLFPFLILAPCFRVRADGRCRAVQARLCHKCCGHVIGLGPISYL